MNSNNKNTFDGSKSLTKTHEHLQSVAGNTSWVNEFKPTDYEHYSMR